MGEPGAPELRRVVCGRTAGGGWGVLQDARATATETMEVQGAPFGVTHLWAADEPGLDPADRAPLAALAQIFSLGAGSTRFLVESMGPTAEPTGWHRTNTIDLEYIVSGEIDLIMEDGSSVTLRQGDVNVQLGGVHQWWNRSASPCVLLIVMIGVPSDETPGLVTVEGSGGER